MKSAYHLYFGFNVIKIPKVTYKRFSVSSQVTDYICLDFLKLMKYGLQINYLNVCRLV
jgi:hypothetical protein